MVLSPEAKFHRTFPSKTYELQHLSGSDGRERFGERRERERSVREREIRPGERDTGEERERERERERDCEDIEKSRTATEESLISIVFSLIMVKLLAPPLSSCRDSNMSYPATEESLVSIVKY